MGQKATVQLQESVRDVTSRDARECHYCYSLQDLQEQSKEGWKMKIISEASLVLASIIVSA